MSAPTSIDLKQRLAPLRMMVMAMAGTMVVLGVIAQVILPEVELDATQLVIAVGLGLVGGVVALLTAGTFIRPLDQDEPNPLVAGLMRLQSATFVQMALADGSALVLFALGFVLPINAMAVLIGLLLAGFTPAIAESLSGPAHNWIAVAAFSGGCVAISGICAVLSPETFRIPTEKLGLKTGAAGTTVTSGHTETPGRA